MTSDAAAADCCSCCSCCRFAVLPICTRRFAPPSREVSLPTSAVDWMASALSRSTSAASVVVRFLSAVSCIFSPSIVVCISFRLRVSTASCSCSRETSNFSCEFSV